MLGPPQDEKRMSTSGVLVRAVAARFLPDLMQKSPRGDPTIDFSLLGRQLKDDDYMVGKIIDSYYEMVVSVLNICFGLMLVSLSADNNKRLYYFAMHCSLSLLKSKNMAEWLK